MIDRFSTWLFTTVSGRVVLACLVPLGLVIWFAGSVIVGEDFFVWLENRQLRRDAGMLK